jgi:hypothetical protein
LGFASGYRFSDTVSFDIKTPLGAGGQSTTRTPDPSIHDRSAAQRRLADRKAYSDPYNFVLQSTQSEIAGLVAQREDNVEQDASFEAGGRIAGRGYSRQNLEVMIAWKMEGVPLTRVMSYLGQNTEAEIDHALRSAIATDSGRSAIEILDRLHGVGVPVASAILTTILREKYTIIDVNALEALGVDDKSKGQAIYYLAYLKKCGALAAQFNVSL